MTKKQAEIIMAYAKSNMSLKEAGSKIYMHPTTVSYNLGKIKEQMGWNPKNFFDLCYLVGVAAQRLGGKYVKP